MENFFAFFFMLAWCKSPRWKEKKGKIVYVHEILNRKEKKMRRKANDDDQHHAGNFYVDEREKFPFRSQRLKSN